MYEEQQNVDQIVYSAVSYQEEGGLINEIQHFHSFRKFQKLTAYYFRFINQLKSNDHKIEFQET